MLNKEEKGEGEGESEGMEEEGGQGGGEGGERRRGGEGKRGEGRREGAGVLACHEIEALRPIGGVDKTVRVAPLPIVGIKPSSPPPPASPSPP